MNVIIKSVVTPRVKMPQSDSFQPSLFNMQLDMVLGTLHELPLLWKEGLDWMISRCPCQLHL